MDFNIIYGPPGSGKTTLAENLGQSIDYVSIGDLSRKQILEDTALGRELKRHLDAVVEYPANLIKSLVSMGLREATTEHLLLDGFPKFQREIPVLAALMKERNGQPGKMVVLEISLDKALDRVAGRLICLSCHKQFRSTEVTALCPNCGRALTRRDDDETGIFSRRFYDYLENNQRIRASLEGMGFQPVIMDAEAATADGLIAALAQ